MYLVLLDYCAEVILIKKIFLIAITFILLFNLNVSASENFVPILMYHNINDNYDIGNKSNEMSSVEFEDQLKALKRSGYNTITFNEYIDYRNGINTLPDNPIIITFDDGYLNNYTTAFPLLKKYDMKATIFIITGRVNLNDSVVYPHFSWEQAKEMENSGYIDIESHTNYHNMLNRISDSSLVYELRKSRYLIKKHLGKDVSILAYPYGFYNENVIEHAAKAGYTAAVIISQEDFPGVNRENENIYKLKRITASGGVSGEELIKIIEKNKEY